MTNAVQTSVKLADGTIHMIGGANYAEFVQNLAQAINDEATTNSLLVDFGRAFVPGALAFGAAEQAINNGIPGTQALPPYTAPPAAPPFTPAPAAVQYIQQADGTFVPAGQAPPAYAPAQAAPPPPAPARQASAPPPGVAPNCDHGAARVWKTGTKKDGTAYSMWKCTMPQGSDCKPIWMN